MSLGSPAAHTHRQGAGVILASLASSLVPAGAGRLLDGSDKACSGQAEGGVLCESGGPVGDPAVPRVAPGCASVTEEGRRTGE